MRKTYWEALRSRGYLDQNIPPRPVSKNANEQSADEYNCFTLAEWRMMRDSLSVPGQGTRWTFHKFLMPSPSRAVGVWRKVNAHNMPISEDVSVDQSKFLGTLQVDKGPQRRVFKMKLSQMYPDPPSPTEELGDYEGIVHELVWERCPEFVPRIFNYGCHDYDLNYMVKRRMEWLELEWMPHGDVWDLMKHYLDHDKILPEPFIWYA